MFPGYLTSNRAQTGNGKFESIFYCFCGLNLRLIASVAEIPVASSSRLPGSDTEVGGGPDGGGGVSGGGGTSGGPGGTGFVGGGLCEGWEGDPPPPPKMTGTIGGRNPPWSAPGGAETGLEPTQGAKGLSGG